AARLASKRQFCFPAWVATNSSLDTGSTSPTIGRRFTARSLLPRGVWENPHWQPYRVSAEHARKEPCASLERWRAVLRSIRLIASSRIAHILTTCRREAFIVQILLRKVRW